VSSFFTHHGLPLLFAAVAVESFGIPVPGETALIAFGVLAAQGHYPAWAVIAVAAVAAIVGDNLGFWLIGRRGGRALIARYGWVERRTENVLPRAEALIERYGGRAVFFGRFVSVLRETIAWVAGLAGMSWPRFLFWNALGGVVWATAFGLLAFFGGKALADAVTRYGLYAGGAIVVAVALVAAAPLLIDRLRPNRARARPPRERPGDRPGL
jgi:membrane protein DedA with SNARE-associated domain